MIYLFQFTFAVLTQITRLRLIVDYLLSRCRSLYPGPADRPLIVSKAVYGEPGSRTLSFRA